MGGRVKCSGVEGPRRPGPPAAGGRDVLSVAILTIGVGVAAPAESPAELAAWIDARVESIRQAKGLPQPPAAGDEVFLRRAYLELTGTIPSVAETRDFLESRSASKYELLIQALL